LYLYATAKYYINDQNNDTLTKETEEPIVRQIAIYKITHSHLVTINSYI